MSANVMKKYLILFVVQIAALWVWAFYGLPEIGESGSRIEVGQWLTVQGLLMLLLGTLLWRRYRPAYFLNVAYGFVVSLCGVGLLGWSLMGSATPASVYISSALFLAAGFGLIAAALKDLNVGQRRRYDGFQNE